jgi:hypothetical protein
MSAQEGPTLAIGTTIAKVKNVTFSQLKSRKSMVAGHIYAELNRPYEFVS